MRPNTNVVLAALLLILATGATADSPQDGATHPLAGAPWTLAVGLTELPAEAVQSGLTVEALTRKVAEELSGAGFRVDPEAADQLHVTVSVSSIRGAGLYAYHTRLDYRQPMLSQHKPGAVIPATTWTTEQTGSSFSAHFADTVQSTVSRLAGHFGNEFSAVNPPPP